MPKKRTIQYFFAAALTALAFAVNGTALAADAATTAVSEVNLTFLYGVAALLSLALLGGYCALARQKNTVFVMLFLSVFLVNLGYLSLALSRTVEEALLANRIAYLGSVLLPLWMLMAILDICRIRYSKRLILALVLLGAAVYLLAASPGYLPLYYKEVSLEFVGGMAYLKKVYGPLHLVYLVYLLGYFVAMAAVIRFCDKKLQTISRKHAEVLGMIVFLNICVWAVEQLIRIHFEFLALSYVVSEVLLVLLNGILADYDAARSQWERERQQVPEVAEDPREEIAGELPGEEEPVEEILPELDEARIEQIVARWPGSASLTARELDVLRCLLQDRRRKEIAEILCVTEHTAKKHTANIFAKLDVGSRKELAERANRETPVI